MHREHGLVVWEYSHYPLDVQMKAKPDRGMDLSRENRTVL